MFTTTPRVAKTLTTGLAGFLLAIGLMALGPPAAGAMIVTFDFEPLGMAWGGCCGNLPGDLAFTEDMIPMTVEEYHLGAFTGFDMARIEPAGANFGENQILLVQNIGVQFDFTAGGGEPDTARFNYADIGGDENLQVNGGSRYEIPLFSVLNGVVVAPGVTCWVTQTAIPGGVKGTVTLAGPVDKVLIGGQELWIDRVRGGGDGGDPPGGGGSGCCDFLVSHDLEPLGMCWGGPHGDAPGDLAFSEDGIPVRLRQFDIAGGPFFDEACIDLPFSGFGDVQTLRFANIDAIYEIFALGVPVTAVTFDFASLGGTENFRVNDGPFFIGDIESAPAAIAPGVTYAVTTWTIPGGIAGRAVLIGDVQRLVIGGQEFWADEVCVFAGEEGGGGCDLMVDNESQAVGNAWGSPFGDSPGDVIFAEDGIDVGIDVITYADMSTGFLEAVITASPNACLVDRTLALNNIAATYDIAGAGVNTAMVYFDYLDLGGVENLQVNGGTLHIGDLADAPLDIAPGVTCIVATFPIPGGVCGRVYLLGDVDRVLVAGQEFWTDELCVISCGVDTGDVCDHELRFEDHPVGTGWGSGYGDSSGDLIFTEDSVPVSIVDFFDGTNWWFQDATIMAALPATGVTDGRMIAPSLANLVFDLGALAGAVEKVTFEFIDWAGIENLQVNGETLFVDEIWSLPANVATGVTYSVDYWPIAGGQAAGVVTLTGNVEKFALGGQQFAIDNVCVVLSATTGVGTPAAAAERLLQPPFPNPFNPKTTLSFSLAEAGPVRLTVHDVAGRQVAELVDERREAGSHRVVWEGRDDAGRAVSSGLYFARIEAGGRVEARKLVLAK